MTLTVRALDHPLTGAEPMFLAVREVDCSKYSDERGDPECERGMQAGVGVAVVVGLLLLAIGFVIWRRLMRKFTTTSSSGTRPDADGPGRHW